MSNEAWIAILSFVSAVLALALKVLTISADVQTLIVFVIGVIGLAVSYFFGVKPILKARAARQVK